MAPIKKKEYSNDLPALVVKNHLDDSSEREIAQEMLIRHTSVPYIIAKHKFTKCIGNISGRGRKRKIVIRVDRCIRRKIMANRRISSSQIKAAFQSDLNVAVSESTVKRRADEAGLFGRLARNKPCVNKIDRAKRLESDETKFNLRIWIRVVCEHPKKSLMQVHSPNCQAWWWKCGMLGMCFVVWSR